MAYTAPEDIANRALQHCGVPPSNRITALTDNSKNAKECALAYHKLRTAELRRNVWRFSIRHAVLRAVDTTTKIYVPPAYAAGTTYAVGDIVSYSDPVDNKTHWFLSNQSSNTGNTPTSGSPWEDYSGPVTVSAYDSTIGFYTGELVYDGSNNVWISLVSANTNALSEGTNWHELSGGTLQALNIIYPIGSGPSSDDTTKNIYRLPYGYLREAPQDPRAGSLRALGASTSLIYTDWRYEGPYIVSAAVDPIIYRFVADWTDVSTMDPMFCEGLAARIGYEICEPITQSTAKMQMLTAEYKLCMSEARLVNGIETGPTEPPEDDYISCRA